MKKKILLVDDDHGPMDYFVTALIHRGFTVEHIDTVDGFFERLESMPKLPDFDVAVVDMMMPHGKRLSREETDGGLESGPLIVRALRNKYPQLSIVALTNHPGEKVMASLPKSVNWKAKFEISPFDFVEFIKSLIPIP